MKKCIIFLTVLTKIFSHYENSEDTERDKYYTTNKQPTSCHCQEEVQLIVRHPVAFLCCVNLDRNTNHHFFPTLYLAQINMTWVHPSSLWRLLFETVECQSSPSSVSFWMYVVRAHYGKKKRAGSTC